MRPWAISAQLIKGLMFGVEYHEEDVEEGNIFYVVLDLGIFRLMYIRGTEISE